MASLDFIDNSFKAYSFVWQNKIYLLKTAIPVLFIKVLSILIIQVTLPFPNILREGLLLMPSHAIEALFLICLIRLYLFNEPIFIWGHPIPVPEEIQSRKIIFHPILDRKTALQYGVAIYLLTKVCLGLLVGILSINVQSELKTIDDPSLSKTVFGIMMSACFFWSIRLLWLYIPAGMGIPILLFFKKIKKIGHSLYFIGIMIICTIPLLIAYALAANITEAIFGINSAANIIFTTFFQSIFLITILSLQTIAICRGVFGLMSNSEKS